MYLASQNLDPVKMIEQPLRAQVMIAQSQAGLWRRNGYALLNQVEFFYLFCDYDNMENMA